MGDQVRCISSAGNCGTMAKLNSASATAARALSPNVITTTIAASRAIQYFIQISKHTIKKHTTGGGRKHKTILSDAL
jgi:hypothetical protein